MSLKIDGISLRNPFVLAPMAGVNCASHRLLCKQYGASLVYTQMYHCEFILYKLQKEGKKAVYDFINIQELERPVAIQIVGNSPEKMAEAAKAVEEIADIVDINFGCCDEGMLKAMCGGYLTKENVLAGEIVKKVVKTINKPVTAKIRIGWDSQNINGVETSMLLEKCGIKALAVHGRTVKQKYGGKANWQIIKQIKNKLSIPVIGNGDIKNTQKAMKILNETGCDLAMIGRRTKGDPAFFMRCLRKLEGINPEVPPAREIFKEFMTNYEKLDKNKSFTELKAHAMWYGKRAGIGPKKREMIAKSKNPKDIYEIFLEHH